MGLIRLLFENPLAFVLIAVPLLYSIIFHELAHGWVAWKMGDPTAKQMGRLSLNPLKHLDPIGTLMLLAFGFGWAKPVPVNFANIRKSRGGLILVSSAGIVVNMMLAFAAVFLLQFSSLYSNKVAATMLYYMAQINIILAAFNLLPIPPLDGSKILMGFLSFRAQQVFSRLEPFGFFIIIALLYIGALNPLIDFFRWIIQSVIRILLFQ